MILIHCRDDDLAIVRNVQADLKFEAGGEMWPEAVLAHVRLRFDLDFDAHLVAQLRTGLGQQVEECLLKCDEMERENICLIVLQVEVARRVNLHMDSSSVVQRGPALGEVVENTGHAIVVGQS